MSYYFLQPPTPLQTDKQPAEFPIHALPENIGEYVTQVAKAVQVHHDMTAVLSLAVLASCAQGKARIQITPEWTEELNLYIAVVAEPGQRKSKIFSTLTKPVTDYVNTYNSENAADICAYRNKLARLISHKNSLINSNASDENIANVQAEISELMAHPKSEMRLIASDCTSEALASVMSSNNDKIAILTDEGVFEVMAGLYNNGKANINIYLNSYDGQAISIDRKSSGSLILKRPLISFGVCCQPSVIGDFISDKCFIGKGLVQRFMFCQPPSLTRTRKLCTTPIDENLKNKYYKVIYKLLHMKDSDKMITLSPEAYALFEKYYDEIETRISREDKYSLNRTFLSKLAGKTARICGLLHLCSNSANCPVSAETMANAIAISRYFDEQNSFLFNESPDMITAEYILDRIKANALKDRCDTYRARDLKRFCQKYNSAQLDEGLIILEEHGYIAFEPDNKSKPNRKYGIYVLNPFWLRQLACQAPVNKTSSI